MLKLKSCSITTDFDGFGVLNDLVKFRHRVRSVFGEVILHGLKGHPLTTISLNLETGLVTTLSEVRINVRGLLKLICDAHFSAKTTVHFRLACPKEGGTHEERATVCMADLCKNLFLLLSEYVTNNLPWCDRNEPPDMSISGRGEVIGMSLPRLGLQPPVSVLYESGSLTRMEVHYRGYEMALLGTRDFTLYDMFHRIWSLIPFFRVWCALRSTYWPDWKRHGGYKPAA